MKVVLVLSGGGAKALAHAGAFRALEQANLVPSHIIATSMGAVVGAALGAGMPFDQVRRRAMGIRRRDIAPFDPLVLVMGLFARSLFPASALRRAIACIVPKTRFEYLRIPLTVTATDLDSGELLLLGGPERQGSGGSGSAPDRRGRNIELADALYATCALPLYFPPLEADGRRLGDGGLRAVLPLDPARELEQDADVFVAVNVGPGFDERNVTGNGDQPEPPPPDAPVPSRLPRVVRTHGEALRIMMAEQTERVLADWPKQGPRLVYVRPVAEREATFAVERVQEYVEMGYQATKKALG
ncbi:MAG TPA: patatin-like phospholipase family protein [Gemmatimonadales bacterium]|jgi:NTE family protein|nr:patatin-like phospholipase family protein [Gemmatimonadales bacterium]